MSVWNLNCDRLKGSILRIYLSEIWVATDWKALNSEYVCQDSNLWQIKRVQYWEYVCQMPGMWRLMSGNVYFSRQRWSASCILSPSTRLHLVALAAALSSPKGSLRAGRAQQSTCESMHLAVTFSAWKDVLYDYICWVFCFSHIYRGIAVRSRVLLWLHLTF